MDIAAYRQLFQQTVYDNFRKNSQWPTLRQVEIEILPTHRDFNIIEVIQSFPGNSYRGMNSSDPATRTFLTLEQIRQCSGSEEDLKNLAKVISYCANKYITSHDEVVIVSNDEIGQHFHFDEPAIRRIGQLIGQVSVISQSSMSTDYSTWTINIMVGVIDFDGMQSIDEYFDRLEKRKKRFIEAQLALSSGVISHNIVNPAPLIEKVAQSDPSDIQAITTDLMQIDNSYYINALRQSQRSFNWALIGAGVGVAFFIAAFIILVLRQSTNDSYIAAIITAASGGVVEIIASIILVLHNRASNQANLCHDRLNRMQRFLVAMRYCETLESDIKQTTRADLIHKLGE